MKVMANDDTQYASVANGQAYRSFIVGGGFDCTVKRESATIALVNVMTPNRKRDWLAEIEVEPDSDLMKIAVEIAQCPEFGNGGYVTERDPGWDNLATRWDDIEIDWTGSD